MPLEIEVEGLRKTFGRREVLKGLSFSLEARRLPEHLRPQRGRQDHHAAHARHACSRPAPASVRVAGHDVREDPMPVRRTIGLISHNPMLYPDLTAQENLRFYADMYGIEGPRGAHHRAARTPRAQPPPLRHRAHLQQRHAATPGHRPRHPPPAACAAARRAALAASTRAPSTSSTGCSPRSAPSTPSSWSRTTSRKGLEWGSQLMIVESGRIVYEHAAGVDHEAFSAVYREHVQEGSVLA